MQYGNVTQQLSVSAQISVNDIEKIKAAGFKAIICNRPDNEGANQPTFAEIAAKAMSLGLHCVYQPVVSGKVTQQDATTFEAHLQNLEGPVLAFCKTGMRAITLWALGAAKTLSCEEIHSISQKAGYNLSEQISGLKNTGGPH